jgi:hypothetical protein
MILNITNFHGQSLITQNSMYRHELINVFRQFFTRNNKLQIMLGRLSREGVTPDNNKPVAEITNHQQKMEPAIEIVKQLLP